MLSKLDSAETLELGLRENESQVSQVMLIGVILVRKDTEYKIVVSTVPNGSFPLSVTK